MAFRGISFPNVQKRKIKLEQLCCEKQIFHNPLPTTATAPDSLKTNLWPNPIINQSITNPRRFGRDRYWDAARTTEKKASRPSSELAHRIGNIWATLCRSRRLTPSFHTKVSSHPAFTISNNLNCGLTWFVLPVLAPPRSAKLSS